MKIVQRSRRHRIIGGVCGGIGEYFDIDPLFIRVLFVVFTCLYGVGIIVYIVLWIITPSAPLETAYNETETATQRQTEYETENAQRSDLNQMPSQNSEKANKNRFLIGLILIIIGALILVNELLPYIDGEYIWSALFIIVGVYLIILSLRGKKSDEN
ncbi:MAG: PspC domain-containing protein [Chloroherpetonaceae bacterium]